jgi:hypothetical protein
MSIPFGRLTNDRLTIGKYVPEAPVSGGPLLASHTDLWFSGRQYRMNGARVSEAVVDGYHTRASARMAQSASGLWLPFSIDKGAVLSGRGYDHRESFTNLAPNGLDPRSIPNNDCTSADEEGSFLGFSQAARVISQGATYHRKRNFLSVALANGTSYGVSCIYAEGTSPNFAIIIRNETTTNTTYLFGTHGALAEGFHVPGTVTDLSMAEVEPGLWKVDFLFNCTETGSSWSIGAGPYSTTAGDDIVLAALQIANKPYAMPFASGTAASDRMKFAAADIGADVDLASEGLTIVWQGKAIATSATYQAMLDAYIDGNNKLSFVRDGSVGDYRVLMQSGGTYSALALSSSSPAALDGTAVTIGVTMRPDGSCRALAADGGMENRTGKTFPAGTYGSLSVGGYTDATPINGLTERVIVQRGTLTDGEFDNLIAGVAA